MTFDFANTPDDNQDLVMAMQMGGWPDPDSLTPGMGHNGPPEDETEDESPFDDREGWVAVARSMRDHWLVGFGQPVKPCDPEKGFCYSRSEAWLDLIMECRYSAGTVNNNGRKMEIKPGQLLGAVSWLASRWNWTPKTVRSFIDKLATEGMIETGTNQGGSKQGNNNGKSKGRYANIITICKYDIYQLAYRDKGQVERRVDGHVKGELGASLGQHIKVETKEQRNKDTKGADAPATKSKFTKAEIELSDQAIALWNDLAKTVNIVGCQSVNDIRRRKLIKRISEIGGLDKFAFALTAIETVDFFVGKVPSKDGRKPFRLDIETLMQTQGNLGDVLCKLIDRAADLGRKPEAQPQQPDEHDYEAMRRESGIVVHRSQG